MDKFFILFVCRHLVIAYHAPNLLKKVLLVFLEELVELKLVDVNYSHYLCPALDDLIRRLLEI